MSDPAGPSRRPTILPLAERPQAIPQTAAWLNAEWGAAEGHSLQETREWVEEIVSQEDRQTALGAFAGPDLLGVALLVDCDLPRRADLTPWLSGLYVAPAARGQGVGARLTDAVAEAAAGFGFSRFYLYTPIAGFYDRLGWLTIEEFDLNGRPFVVMEKKLES